MIDLGEKDIVVTNTSIWLVHSRYLSSACWFELHIIEPVSLLAHYYFGGAICNIAQAMVNFRITQLKAHSTDNLRTKWH